MAFSYYSPLSINSGQVPSTQTDFPVLVSVTDARFKTVANSGHVQNASGFDIRPYTDSTLTTAITGYELEKYTASTGELVMWVKVSSLSSSTTPFVLAYGNSALTTDGSSATTWSNSFSGVYHLADLLGTNLRDSTGLNTNGITHGSPSNVAGQIGGGILFPSASTSYADMSNGMNPAAATLSAWVKATTFASAYEGIIVRSTLSGSTNFTILYVKSSGKLACFVKATASVNYDGTGSHTLTTGNWFYLTMTYSSAAGLVGYVNGASDGTAAANGAINTTAVPTWIANDPGSATNLWNGVIDEARVASVARSANWITTEYNNQSAPGTFETLGTEVAAAGTRQSNWMLFF